MFMSSRVFSWRGEEKVKWKKRKEKKSSGYNYVDLNSSSGVSGDRAGSPTAQFLHVLLIVEQVNEDRC